VGWNAYVPRAVRSPRRAEGRRATTVSDTVATSSEMPLPLIVRIIPASISPEDTIATVERRTA
jgi:hypothetical protein